MSEVSSRTPWTMVLTKLDGTEINEVRLATERKVVISLNKPSTAAIVKDRLERPMVLFTEEWEKQYAIKQNPEHQIVDISV